MPALVRIESLGPFFNTLAADDKYSRRNMQKFQQQLQTALSQKQKIFLQFLLLFIKPTLNLEHFDKKNVSLLISVFPKVFTPKEVVTWTSKAPFFRTLSAINVFRSSKHCRNQHYITIILLFHEYEIN